MFEHRLGGCNSKPLASYLKSLGIFRLLAEQKDPQAGIRWEADSLSIRTCLNKDELSLFFCEEYAPTPIVSPWNGSSGFYPNTECAGMVKILNSSADRFSDYRSVIEKIKGWDFMPVVPRTVGDVLGFLGKTRERMRFGKSRNEITKLIEDIEDKVPKREILNSDDFQTVKIDSIKFKGKGSGELEESLKKWASLVMHGKTKCIGIQRHADADKIRRYARAELPDVSVAWLDAVYALNRSGKASFSPLLGAGGKDTKLDRAKTFMDNVALLLLNGKGVNTYRLFEQAIYDSIIPGFVDGKIGMYDPGRAGGFNQGSEVETKEFKINPWDLVLMIEGTLVLASSTARRNVVNARDQFTAPFTVDFSPVGFASNEYKEAGREIWLPLWENWVSLPELKFIFGEGRSTVGRKMAQNGTSFCLSLGSFGVDRGIAAFERFVFLKRRGKDSVAIPVGRMGVKFRPGIDLLEELGPILLQTDGFIKKRKGRNHWDRVPARLLDARRLIEQAILNCARQPGPQGFNEVLRALGRLERFFASRDRSQKPRLYKPLFGLSPRWISASDDGRVEIRLAAAVASICPIGKVGSFRSYLAPVDPSDPWKWSEEKTSKVWFGSNIAERISAVYSKRLVDAEKYSLKFPPFKALLSVRSHDVMAFLQGYCDDVLLEELLWGFTLIDWRGEGFKDVRDRWKNYVHWLPISRTWALLKILYSPDGVRKTAIKLEPRIPNLLLAGRVREACQLAIRRLRIEQLDPFEVDYQEELDPTRLLASLMIPITDQHRLENMVLGTPVEKF